MTTCRTTDSLFRLKEKRINLFIYVSYVKKITIRVIFNLATLSEEYKFYVFFLLQRYMKLARYLSFNINIVTSLSSLYIFSKKICV